MKSTASTPRVMSRWISAILILGLSLSIRVFYRSGYAQKYTHLAMVDIIDSYNIAHPRA
jgi:hypothetical protein